MSETKVSTVNYMSSSAYNLFNEICEKNEKIKSKVSNVNFFVSCSSSGSLDKKWTEFADMIKTINDAVIAVTNITLDYCNATENSVFRKAMNTVVDVVNAVNECFVTNPFTAGLNGPAVTEFASKLDKTVNAYVIGTTKTGASTKTINFDKALSVAIYAGIYKRCLGVIRSFNANARHRVKQVDNDLPTETFSDKTNPQKIPYDGMDYDEDRDVKFYGQSKAAKFGLWIENKWNANLPIALIDKYVIVFKPADTIGKTLAGYLGYYGDVIYYLGKKCRSAPTSFLYNIKPVRLMNNNRLKRYSLRIELDAERDKTTGEITKRKGLIVTATALTGNYNYKFDESKSSKSATLYTTYIYYNNFWYTINQFSAIAVAANSLPAETTE